MKKNIAFYFCLFALSLSCSQTVRENRGAGTFPAPPGLKDPVALFIKERKANDIRYFSMTSGFLIDRENGFFITAKHFLDFEDKKPYRAFILNGRIYNVKVDIMPGIDDFMRVRIIDPFDPNELPTPYPFAKEEPKWGDKVYIKGIHRHNTKRHPNVPKDLPVLDIIESYYKLPPFYKNKIGDIVFDSIPAKVVNLNYAKSNSNIGGSDRAAPYYITNSYIRLEAEQDHGTPFSGLSGGPVVNENGEIVGVVSWENKRSPHKDLSIVPISKLKDFFKK